MNKTLTCNQVSSLINFYIENKLTKSLRESVDFHLKSCPVCKKKIEDLQKILEEFHVTNENIEQNDKIPEMVYSLSAYMDNELGNSENIKIKKMMIANPDVRQELETMYKYKKILHSAFNKTKNDTKIDYSKAIVSKIDETNPYSTTYFYKLACIFAILISAILVGFIYLYF
jgi:hypothetical protein